MGSLECALRKKNAVISDDADWIAHKPCKAAYKRCAVELFKFVKATSVDQTSNYLTYIIAFAVIFWDYPKEFIGIIERRFRCSDVPGDIFASIQMGDNAAADCKGMFIIHR